MVGKSFSCPASNASFPPSIALRSLVRSERARHDEARWKATCARALEPGHSKETQCRFYPVRDYSDDFRNNNQKARFLFL